MVDSIKLIGLSSSFVIGFLLAKTPNFPFFWSFPDLNHRLVVVFWLNRRDSLWLTRACDICWESFPRQPILSFALSNCSGFARIILLESIDYNIYSVWGSHPKLNNHLYLNFLCKMSFFGLSLLSLYKSLYWNLKINQIEVCNQGSFSSGTFGEISILLDYSHDYFLWLLYLCVSAHVT